MALSSHDREKLVRLLAMFSSDFDGEVVNAARATHRLIIKSGETWEQIISAPPSLTWNFKATRKAYSKPAPTYYEDPEHWEEIKDCQKMANLLTSWELEFLTSILGRDSLTDKQRSRLDQIKAKLAKYKDVDF